MEFFRCCVLFSLFATCILGEKVRYDNYTVYRITPQSEEQLLHLTFLENDPIYSFWQRASKVDQTVDVAVSPIHKGKFSTFLKEDGWNYKILINNIQDVLDDQIPKNRAEHFDFHDYHTLSTINAYLKKLVSDHPGIVKLVKAGSSNEGRDILGVHVSFTPNNTRNTVFVEAGIHAREWIATSTSLFILTELLTSADLKVRDVAESYDWYFFPSFNPDGYEYSHTTDRLWRKTRSLNGNCYGVDGNRNWDFHWMEAGADDDSCAEFYGGPSAFSEAEFKTASEFITSIHENLVGYIAFHSYSQYLLTPYGHTADLLDNYEQLHSVGLRAANSLKQRYGTEFEVGTFYSLLYPGSGTSVDWVKGNFGTPITYTIELRDKGELGFLLPPEQIIPSGLETLDGFVKIFQEAKIMKR